MAASLVRRERVGCCVRCARARTRTHGRRHGNATRSADLHSSWFFLLLRRVRPHIDHQRRVVGWRRVVPVQLVGCRRRPRTILAAPRHRARRLLPLPSPATGLSAAVFVTQCVYVFVCGVAFVCVCVYVCAYLCSDSGFRLPVMD